MLFKVVNNATGRSTHCGVLEFIAQEGHVYLPRWVSRSQDCMHMSFGHVWLAAAAQSASGYYRLATSTAVSIPPSQQ